MVDGLEGGADGHLGLAVADVAADEAVHGAGALHVGLGLVDGLELVGGLGEGEGCLKLALPGVVLGEGVAGLGLARGVQAQEFGGEVDGGELGGLARLFPAVRADAAELRAHLAQADVAADQVRLLKRHVQQDVVVELEGDRLAHAIAGLDLGQAAVHCDAVLEVHHEVALDQFGEVEQLVDLVALGLGALGARRAARALAAEYLGLGDEDEGVGALAEEGQGRKGGGLCIRGGTTPCGGAEVEAEALGEGASQEEGLEALELGVGGEDLACALLLAVARDEADDRGLLLLPEHEAVEEAGARLLLVVEALLGDEGVGGVVAVVAEALGFPEEVARAALGKTGGGLVEVA